MSRLGFITERMLRGFGVDLVVHQLAQGLADRGHDVTVYASTSDGTFSPSGYRIQQIPTPASSLFPRCDLAAQEHLPFLNMEGNDVWLVQTFPFFSLLPRLSAPAIAVDYGVSSTEGFPLKIRANFAYVKFMQEMVYFRRAKRVVTISDFLRRELPAGLRRKAGIIYPGADHYLQAAAEDSGSLREELGVDAGDVIMLYVGRLSAADQPYKGTAALVELYRRLRQSNRRLRLLMVGFGGRRERDWLEAADVLVIENAPAGMMPAVFKACDFYVTASQWEGFDLPLAEAQSFGKPVAALNIGAHPEVVADGESGFLAGSLSQLETAVRELAVDSGLRSGMGKAATRQAQRFRWEDAVTAYERLLQEVVD